MEFISMDLIGEFRPPSSKGNRYALTATESLIFFSDTNTQHEDDQGMCY